MKFSEPFKVYTASNNMEAHLVVNMLTSNGVAAYADEDQSGSFQLFGGQVYKPNVWIEKSTTEKAVVLLRQYEDEKLTPTTNSQTLSDLQVECEECGKTTEFSQALDGTTQECPHCYAYVDVGELDWDEDFGEPEE